MQAMLFDVALRPGQQARAGRRAQRGGVEVRVPQPVVGDAAHASASRSARRRRPSRRSRRRPTRSSARSARPRAPWAGGTAPSRGPSHGCRRSRHRGTVSALAVASLVVDPEPSAPEARVRITRNERLGQARGDGEPEHGHEPRDAARLARGLGDHRVDEHDEQRAGREPVDGGAQVTAGGVGDRVAGDRRDRADDRDDDPQQADRPARGRPRAGRLTRRSPPAGSRRRSRPAGSRSRPRRPRSRSRARPAPAPRPAVSRARASRPRRAARRRGRARSRSRRRPPGRRPTATRRPTSRPSSNRSKLTALISAPAPNARTTPTTRSGHSRTRPSSPPRISEDAASAPQPRASTICGRYCLAIASWMKSSGSMRWSWLSSPASISIHLIVPVNALSPAG